MSSRNCRARETTTLRLTRSTSDLSGGLSRSSLTEGRLRSMLAIVASPRRAKSRALDYQTPLLGNRIGDFARASVECLLNVYMQISALACRRSISVLHGCAATIQLRCRYYRPWPARAFLIQSNPGESIAN